MIVEIILGILTITLSYTTYNQFQKVERLETWIENFTQKVNDTNDVLTALDSEGKFESDDEIGTVFAGIKDTVTELNEITKEDI